MEGLEEMVTPIFWPISFLRGIYSGNVRDI